MGDDFNIPGFQFCTMKTDLLYLIIFAFTLMGCEKDQSTVDHTDTGKIIYGKIRVTTQIDGDDREYFVHVPKSYTGNQDVPVVFMLHGTSGKGEEFYEKSGWREVGESQNLITVFPSSWRYCIISQGETSTTTKWNTAPDAEWTFCTGQTPRNDLKFLRTIIDELSSKYKVDSKRIYLVGFSNGGQMAAKCTIELSDKLAAVVQSAGTFYLDTVYIPKRKLAVLYQVGDEDYGPGNTGPAIPMNQLSYLISTPGLDFKNGRFNTIAMDHVRNFALQPHFTIGGDTTKFSFATYKPLLATDKHEFQFVMIKGLGHMYPNGDNHFLESAELNWNWMKQFSQ